MVDYTQRALEAYLAKKQAEKDEFDRRKAKERQVLNDHLRKVSSQINAQLAAVLGADPDAPEFSHLAWDFEHLMQVELERDGTYTISTTQSDRGISYTTEFQGMTVHARTGGQSYFFSATTSANGGSSQGFNDLESFGSAVASFRVIKDAWGR